MTREEMNTERVRLVRLIYRSLPPHEVDAFEKANKIFAWLTEHDKVDSLFDCPQNL